MPAKKKPAVDREAGIDRRQGPERKEPAQGREYGLAPESWDSRTLVAPEGLAGLELDFALAQPQITEGAAVERGTDPRLLRHLGRRHRGEVRSGERRLAAELRHRLAPPFGDLLARKHSAVRQLLEDAVPGFLRRHGMQGRVVSCRRAGKPA